MSKQNEHLSGAICIRQNHIRGYRIWHGQRSGPTGDTTPKSTWAGKKRYQSVYAKTPAELKEKETAVRLQLGRGLDILSQRDSFAAWADDWPRLKERENITCRQMDNYRRAVKLWKEELQGYEIGQVRADDIERLLALACGKGKQHQERYACGVSLLVE